MRRSFLRPRNLAKLVALSAAVFVPGCGGAPDTNPPNIVIIVADDLGWADVGYHGSRIKTPNIDKLAAEGVELDRFYVYPICTPTRAGLMTGRYPIRFGLARAVIPPWRRFGLDPDEITLAQMLEKAGYRHRGIFGKWHLGHLERRWHPLARGFTRFHGHYNGAIDYFSHRRDGERDWHIDYEPSDERGYATNLIADAASRFISDKAGQGPFFCYVPFGAPHQPFQVPEVYLRKYSNMQGNKQVIAGMITCLDDGIGKILDSIDRAGIRDNTLVWFFSDNGGIKEFADNNLPLRGNKLDLLEGGIRVPSCVRWPGGFDGGRKIALPTAFIDIFPTLMRIAGVEDHGGKPVDGVALVDVLRGETTEMNRELFFYEGQQGPHAESVAG